MISIFAILGISLLSSADVIVYPKYPKFVVAQNGSKHDAPMWSYKALQGGVWASSGRIPIGTLCEPSEIRKTGFKYHFVTNAKGQRDLAVCIQEK